jgi:hypothetical protein
MDYSKHLHLQELCITWGVYLTVIQKRAMPDISYKQDNNLFAGSNMRDAQAKWDRLTESDLAAIRTKAQLIARVEERYSLPHDVAAEDVEIWGLDRRF